VPIVPLLGHEAVLGRLRAAATRGALPASLLLHGPAGVGKQRLALEVARTLLCAAPDASGSPCGACEGCRFGAELAHPDLHWYFPRPRPKDGDQKPATVEQEYRELVADRVADGGLYGPASGSDGLHVATVRAMLQQAAVSPALGRRKVFVVGGADRMVPQEGADQAANAFLKLLEEPPADTTLILTSSEVGALLPTIRSRVVSVRVPALPDATVRAFLDHEMVRAWFAKPKSGRELPRASALRPGVQPGELLAGAAQSDVEDAARRLLDAAGRGRRADALRAALSLGASKARGGFTDTLDALAVQTHARTRDAALRGDADRARRLASAMDAIEDARERARGNVSPQLLGVALTRALARALR
jgi:DNA polymerase-3 subunit delta'